MNTQDDQAVNWLAAVSERNALASMMHVARIAATLYIGALAEGLTAAGAKDVVEATMAAYLRTARESQEKE